MGDFNPNVNPDTEPVTVENFDPNQVEEVDPDSVKDFKSTIE